MKFDIFTGNAIGFGETAGYVILKDQFQLTSRFHHDFTKKLDGIYTQIPLPWLLDIKFLQDLDHCHRRGSIDIVIVKNGKPIAIRVQGWSHFGGKKRFRRHLPQGYKAQKDHVQKYMLYESGIPVVDFDVNEMPHLFAEKIDNESRFEINYFFRLHLLAYISAILSKQLNKG